MNKLLIALMQAAHGHPAHAEALESLDAALADARTAGAGLLVTPELFLTGYGDAPVTLGQAVPSDGAVMRQIRALAARHRVGLVLGYAERDGAAVYNSAAYIDRDGRLAHNYRKQFLPNDYERGCFSTGSGSAVFSIDGVPASLVICYDVEFPEIARRAALDGALLLIAPTALTSKWRVVSDVVVPARAFENGIFVAYCNFAPSAARPDFAGLSTVCGPSGEVTAKAGTDAGLVLAEIDLGKVAEVRRQLRFLEDLAATRRAEASVA